MDALGSALTDFSELWQTSWKRKPNPCASMYALVIVFTDYLELWQTSWKGGQPNPCASIVALSSVFTSCLELWQMSWKGKPTKIRLDKGGQAALPDRP
eukprot:1156764-Pelagomonas_calceolata.AAC.3